MKTLISVMLFLAIGQAAHATTALTCKNQDDANLLLLQEETPGRYSLELIDPAALAPLAHLKLWSQVDRGAAILTVDHFESRIGDLQLVAVFPVGGFRSKHVYFRASFAVDRDNGGSYGLKLLEGASATQWTCEE